MPPAHTYLVDWNDDGAFDHPLSDITGYVISCGYDYGAGVTNSPREIVVRLLNGRLRFHTNWDRADINQLIADGKLFQPHRFKHIVDGAVSVDCVMDIIDGRRARLLSHNANAFTQRIQMSYASSVADSKIFHDAMSQAGVAQAASTFPHSMMAAPLIINMPLLQFLRQFSRVVGGYIVEGIDGRIGFHAPLANQHPAPRLVSETTNPLFENDITVKAGEVRNSADIVITLPQTAQETISVVTIAVGAQSTEDFEVRAPRNALVSNWAASGASITSATPTLATIHVRNPTPTAASITITVSGTVTRARQIIIHKNYPDSIALYGEKPYRQDFDWLADKADARREIHRRSKARHIVRQSFPLIDENREIAFLDTGAVLTVSSEDEAYRCMIGRRSVQVDRYMTVGWDLVEMPVSDSDDYWTIGVSKLGVNTRLAPERVVTNNFLYLGGKLLLLGGKPLEIVNDINYLTLGGKPLTLGGKFLEIVKND